MVRQLKAFFAAVCELYADSGFSLAAAVAFSFVLSLFPFVIFLGAFAGYFGGEALAQRAQQRLETAGARASIPEIRTGVGVDVHAFDDGMPLWLGGVYWPNVPGLAGHSDGDAVCHAICDALLSAAGLGDIGARFGTADPRFLDAHGEVFITETVAIVTGAGWRIQNVAVQVISNEPRIGPRRHEIEHTLGALVGAPVSVAGTTTDHLGFTGRGEGVTAIATALLTR